MNTLEKHIEFHETFDLPILTHPNQMSHERNELRLKLAIEELHELAQAYGLEYTFFELINKIKPETLIDTEIIDPVAVLDALVDIEVINNGTILENGFKDVYIEAYKQTHDNNMSKSHDNIQDAEESDSYHQYTNNHQNTQIKERNGKFILYRNDGKVLKPKNYISNDLTDLIQKHFEI